MRFRLFEVMQVSNYRNDTWYGMTYKEDVAAVTESFGEMIKAGKYSEDLYSDL